MNNHDMNNLTGQGQNVLCESADIIFYQLLTGVREAKSVLYHNEQTGYSKQPSTTVSCENFYSVTRY